MKLILSSRVFLNAVAFLMISMVPQTVQGFMQPVVIKSFVSKESVRQMRYEGISPLSAATTDVIAGKNSETSEVDVKKRVLGSQENLMLPRQYGPHLNQAGTENKPFPMMTHVCGAVLSATPSIAALEQALQEAMESHPLLRCHVEGDGEPTKRIDLFQMVREGEPNPCTFVCPPLEDAKFSVKDIVSVVDVDSESFDTAEEALTASWKEGFNNNLEDNDWCDVTTGPLWKVQLHRSQKNDDSSTTPCALLFTFNHAISDQSSANMLLDQILSNIDSIESSGKIAKKALQNDIPVSLEDSVMGMNKSFSDVTTEGMSLNTAGYVLGKAAEGFRSPVILPDDAAQKEDNGGLFDALTIITGKAPGGEDKDSYERKSTSQFRTLPAEVTKKILDKCRANGVTISNALSAAITLTASDFIDGGETKDSKSRNYKVLQSLDMRRFGAGIDKCDSVACMAGSHDLMLGPIADKTGEALRQAASDSEKKKLVNQFWDLAKESKEQTDKFISTDGPSEATRVFDFAMTISDMNNLIHLSAQSKDTQGRAYSAGIVNAGVYERQKAVQREGEKSRSSLKSKHGKYQIENLHFATTHARTGCLYQASCVTINDEIQCTFHPASPIISEESNRQFSDAFIDLLNTIADLPTEGKGFSLPSNSLSLAAAAAGVGGVAIHANAWSNFFNAVMTMKEATPDPSDFWAALNFWIFFAVGHPILQPILWISDVLHGTPGPKIADLVPVAFLLGNLAFIATITISKEIRNAVNIAALSAFITYIGAGLDGQAGMGDFNLALDDPYHGKVIKGCPSYEEVRQPSMDNFDLNKYQGLWYEQKFHDWTQFKEVYDTTLDIKVSFIYIFFFLS